jgi:hypothetical protein
MDSRERPLPDTAGIPQSLRYSKTQLPVLNLIKWMLLKMMMLLIHLFLHYITLFLTVKAQPENRSPIGYNSPRVSIVMAILLLFSVLLYVTFFLDPLQSRH